MAIAFPGAQGWAAGAQGARAGNGTPDVYWVTNTNDGGDRSLRKACEASGPRYVVFQTGGLFECHGPIEIRDPYITILGQTAPGGGITLTRPFNGGDGLMDIDTDEVIIRYLRFRGTGHPDNLTHSGDCLGIGNHDDPNDNIIVDHCSFSGATDETIDTWSGCKRYTMQWCLIGPALQDAGHEKGRDHGFGTILGGRGSTQQSSLHHCLFAHIRTRCPKINPDSNSGVIEVINNIIYNAVWRTGDWGASHHKNQFQPSQVNYLGNVCRIGANRDGLKGWYISGNSSDACYLDDNQIMEEDGSIVTNNDEYRIKRTGDGWEVGTAHTVGHAYPITVEGYNEAWESVLNGCGCTVPVRDRLDQLMVSQTRNGTGTWIDRMHEVGGVDTPASGTPWTINGAYNMPQYWLDEHGNHSATDIDPSTGYSYLELWANSLSGDATPPGGGGGGGTPPPVPPPPTETGTPVIAGADDCSTNDGTTGHGFTYTNTIMPVGNFSATEYNSIGYVRFQGIDVLNRSTLSDARLRMFMSGLNGTMPAMTIYTFDEDDARDLDDETDVMTRLASLTTASVPWTPDTADDEWKTSPDISPLLEEIFARPGWVSGGSIVLVIRPDNPTYSIQERAKFRSYDGDPTLSARLEIEGVAAPVGHEETASGSIDHRIVVGGDSLYIRDDDYLDATNERNYIGKTDVAEKYATFLRFPGSVLQIPQGATIDAANLWLEPGSQRGTSWDVEIFCVDEDDPSMPTTNAQANSMNLTTASVQETWSSLTNGVQFETAELKTIVQEVVDRAGFNEESAILFVIHDPDHEAGGYDPADESRIGIKAYENGANDDARLVLEWSTVEYTQVEGTLAKKILDVGMDAGLDAGIN